MITTTSYNFVTARQIPKMTTIVPSIHGNKLHLEAPGVQTMKVNMEADQLRERPVVKTQ
jgi:uncharacterized protein YcbX